MPSSYGPERLPLASGQGCWYPVLTIQKPWNRSMLKLHASCLAASTVPAAITVHLDTLSPGTTWTPGMYALDFGLLLACWHVIVLAGVNVAGYAIRRRRRYGAAWLG